MYLVEEHILAIGVGGQHQAAVGANAVLGAQPLPKLVPDLVAALAHLQCDDLARHL